MIIFLFIDNIRFSACYILTSSIENHLDLKKGNFDIMNQDNILFEVVGSIAWLRLNRPKQLNSINRAMLKNISTHLSIIENDSKVRVLIITGVGRSFCAGSDLKDFINSGQKLDSKGHEFIDALKQTYDQLRNFPKPVICGLNGITMAGGLELAMCCDIIFAAEGAKIGDGHSNYGIFPSGGATVLLPEKIGLSNAKYLLFSGNTFSAYQLHIMGLIQEVVPDQELITRLNAFAEQISKKSNLGLIRMKEAANSMVDLPRDQGLEIELEMARNHCKSSDMKEGINAFVEKRKPNFK